MDLKMKIAEELDAAIEEMVATDQYDVNKVARAIMTHVDEASGFDLDSVEHLAMSLGVEDVDESEITVGFNDDEPEIWEPGKIVRVEDYLKSVQKGIWNV